MLFFVASAFRHWLLDEYFFNKHFFVNGTINWCLQNNRCHCALARHDSGIPVMVMELTFGEKIRLLREERELNQTELGRAVGMTQRKVSYLERGEYEPSLEDIRALCLFFRVSADYLLGFPKALPYPKRGK